jgi:GH25 family lysozyme M1 (1,4-beta-N-acetylmuramidase)
MTLSAFPGIRQGAKAPAKRTRPSQARQERCLVLEVLEDRCLLSGYTLTNSFGSLVNGSLWNSSGPFGLAVDQSSNVFVADAQNNRIVKFDHANNYNNVPPFGIWSGGQLFYPSGVAVDQADNVFVADSLNNRIVKFTNNGITQFGNDSLGFPWDVAVDPSGNVFVADSNSSGIVEFDESGAYVRQFGYFSSNNGDFATPWYLAVDPSGDVIVAQTGNGQDDCSIVEFNNSGTQLAQFSIANGNGLWDQVGGVAVDQSGNIFVADAQQGIEEFSNSGTKLTQFGTTGSLAVDPSDNVFVFVTGSNVIGEYSPTPDHLAVSIQPPNPVSLGKPFDVTISAEDPHGNLDMSFNGPITIALGNNPEESTLGGTTTVQAVHGFADFPDLTLDQLGRGYTLKASSSGSGYVITDQFNAGYFGVDVSDNEEGLSIDWHAVTGQTFAIIKATEGTSLDDPAFVPNVTGAIGDNIAWGAYHYANPNADTALANLSNTAELLADADREADHFAQTAGPYLTVGNLEPVLDLEASNAQSGFRGFNATTADDFKQVAMWATEWINKLKCDLPELQLNPILYMNQDYAQNLSGISPSLTSYPLWIAAPNDDPNWRPRIGPWSTWKIMQWSWTGSVSGMPSNVVNLDVLSPDTSLTSLEIAGTNSGIPTEISMLSSANPSVDGQQVGFMATTTSNVLGAGTPAGAVQFQVDGQNLGPPMTLRDGKAVSLEIPLPTGASYVTATYLNDDGGFLGSCTSLFGFQQVNSLTAANLEQVLSPDNPVTIEIRSISDFGNAINAVNELPSYSNDPSTVTLDLAPGNYPDVAPKPPPGVTLVINGNGTTTTFVGHSPALTLTTGNVTINGVTFITATDAPTILVTGGNLTLRNDMIQESTSFTDASIAVSGGVLDLGTVSDPGGNTLNVNGTGELVHNSTSTPVSAFGDTFEVDATALGSPYLSFTAASSSTSTSVYGQAVTLTAMVRGNTLPGSGTPGGSVDFYDTSTGIDLGTVALSEGSNSLIASALAVGSHVIQVRYGGDNNFTPSIDAVALTVKPAPLTEFVLAIDDPNAPGSQVVIADGAPAGTTVIGPGGVTMTTTAASMVNVPGLIIYMQPVDAFSFEMTVAMSSPLLTGDALFVDTLAVSRQPGTLNVMVSANGYQPTDLETPTLQSPIGGVTRGTVTFQEFVDPNNGTFNTTSTAQTPGLQGPFSAGAFGDMRQMTVSNLSGAFAITKELNIVHQGPGVTGVGAWGVIKSMLAAEPDLQVNVQNALSAHGLGQWGLGLPALLINAPSESAVAYMGVPHGGGSAGVLALRNTDDLLIGGAGNDLQIGGQGRDLLIGGFGSDHLQKDNASLSGAAESSSREDAIGRALDQRGGSALQQSASRHRHVYQGVRESMSVADATWSDFGQFADWASA